MIEDKATILERLRTETRDQHEQLENVAASDKLAKGTLSAAEYAQLLKANYAAHRKLESILAQVPGIEAILEGRQKTPLLERDLQQAKIDAAAVWEQLNPLLPSPQPETRHQALGMQYVMEGATLGGAVILKALQQHPHLQAHQPFHYYGCYGGDRGRRWSSFKQLLLQEAQSLQAEEEILEGAKTAYQLFEKAFRSV